MNHSSIVALTLAMALAPAHAVVAKGLTNKQARQVQSFVRQEVARAIQALPTGPQGPQGPAGPPGTPGTPGGPGADVVVPLMRYAHVDLDTGQVDESRSYGITRANMFEEIIVFEGPASPLPDGRAILSVTYCFVDLGPIVGGQVVIDGLGEVAVLSPKLHIEPAQVDCPVRVAVHGFERVPGDNQEPPIRAGFYVLLY